MCPLKIKSYHAACITIPYHAFACSKCFIFLSFVTNLEPHYNYESQMRKLRTRNVKRLAWIFRLVHGRAGVQIHAVRFQGLCS